MILYVDLSRQHATNSSEIQAQGTISDMFAWSDVCKFFNDLPVQVGALFDANNNFQHLGFDVEMLFKGDLVVTNSTSKIDFSLVPFLNQKIRWKNQNKHIPTITFNNSSLYEMFKAAMCENLYLDIQGFHFNMDASAETKLFSVSNCRNSVVLAHNNILSAKSGFSFVDCDTSTQVNLVPTNDVMLFAGLNTCFVKSPSIVGTMLFKAKQVTCFANYVHRDASSAGSVVVCNAHITKYSGNRYFGMLTPYMSVNLQSSLENLGSPDQTLLSIGVHGSYVISGNDADIVTSEDVSALNPLDELMSACLQSPLWADHGIGVFDIESKPRKSMLDAGALQSNLDSTAQVVFDVDLELVGRQYNNGTEESKLSKEDALIRYSRLGRLNHTMLLRLSGISASSDVSFANIQGSGKLIVTTKDNHCERPACLVGNLQVSSPHDIELTNMFHVGDVVANASAAPNKKLLFKNCVVRANLIQNTATAHTLDIDSCTLHSRANQTLFQLLNPSRIEGCLLLNTDTFNLPIGSSVAGTTFKNNLVQGVVLSSIVFGGATLSNNRLSNMNRNIILNSPDEDDSNIEDADYSITGAVLSCLDIRTATQDETDILGLYRDASPYGLNKADAGAYEYNYRVDQPTVIHVDFDKLGQSGTGDYNNPYNLQGLQSFFDSLPTSLTSPIKLVGRFGNGNVTIRNKRATRTGYIEVVAPLWRSMESLIVVENCVGLVLRINNSILKTYDNVPSILERSSRNTLYVSQNSVWLNEYSASFKIVGNVQAGDFVVIDSVQQSFTQASTTDEEILSLLSAMYPAITFTLFGNRIYADVTTVVSGSDGLEVSNQYRMFECGQFVALGSAFKHKSKQQHNKLIKQNGKFYYCGIKDESDVSSGLLGLDVETFWCAKNTPFTNMDQGSVVGPTFDIGLEPYDDDSITAIGNAVGVVQASLIPTQYYVRYDKLGNHRANQVSVGPIEPTPTNTPFSLMLEQSSEPIARLTDLGKMLDARMLTGDVRWKIEGYKILAEGYQEKFWQASPLRDAVVGRQSVAMFQLTNNAVPNNSFLRVTFAPGVFVETALNQPQGFVQGATIAETVRNIAKSLRDNPAFYRCTVVNDADTLVISSVLFKSLGYTLTGNFGSITPFDQGLDPVDAPQVYPDNGLSMFDFVEYPNASTLSLTCRLGQSRANLPLGCLVVYARILSSNIQDEVDSLVPYCYVSSPAIAKNSSTIIVKRIILQ